ncbi:MAG: hypothetical protein KDA84_12155, partial [Planctomycetaceae bacterium]|nr:hypothetical protein [Planctomycetaceae bacterium]
MIFLLSLLAYFVDGKPSVPVPAPEPLGAITVPGEFDAPVSKDTPYHELGDDQFGVPQLVPPTLPGLPSVSDHQRGSFCGTTPPTFFSSPSMRVAHPPALAKTYNVFSPAVRSPLDLPGLFPCDPVALVPCPTPEPPAIRHVSFLDSVLPNPSAYPDCSLPHPSAYGDCYEPIQTRADHSCPSYDAPAGAPSQCEKQPVRPYAASHPFPVYSRPPIHPPHLGHLPVAIAGPIGGPICPVGGPCPAPGDSPFPGAKKIQHVVRATY